MKSADIVIGAFYLTTAGEIVRCSGKTTDGKHFRVWTVDSQEGFDVTARDLLRSVDAPGAAAGVEECEDNACAGCAWCTAAAAAAAPDAAAVIRARCEHDGFYVVSEGTLNPALVIKRLLAALAALSPEPRRLPLVDAWVDAIPHEARADEHHAYWDTDATRDALTELMLALSEVAPPGFAFANEGTAHRLGFFRCF